MFPKPPIVSLTVRHQISVVRKMLHSLRQRSHETRRHIGHHSRSSFPSGVAVKPYGEIFASIHSFQALEAVERHQRPQYGAQQPYDGQRTCGT